MFHTGFQLRPGANQVPRQTLRHWPILAATVTAAAVIVAAFAVTSRAAPRLQRLTRTRAVAEDMLQFPDAPPAAAAPVRDPKIQAVIAHTIATELTYTTHSGDTLSSIAKAQSGHASYWPELWLANRSHVHNPAALNAGTQLTLPVWRPVSPWLLRVALAAIPKPPPPRHVSAPGTGQGVAVAAAPAVPAAPSYSGGVLTAAQVGAYWLGAGGPAWAESAAEAVAYCESGYNPAAYNPSGATGLFQILGQVVPGNLTDPAVNAANAVAKFNASGQTWAQWVCTP